MSTLTKLFMESTQASETLRTLPFQETSFENFKPTSFVLTQLAWEELFQLVSTFSFFCVESEFLTEIVRMLAILRVNVLSKGHSGITPENLKALLKLINYNLLPLIPVQGNLCFFFSLDLLTCLSQAQLEPREIFVHWRIWHWASLVRVRYGTQN